MSAPHSIRIENVGKRYRLGAVEPYKTLRDAIMRRVREGGAKAAPPKEIWALDDVSFDVREGEVVGIIGRNGAGKSTLLKLLTRITRPDKGTITYKGRIAALLEVGTGFHPELTGRENIFLNGAILGMSRADIERRFDEIVDFSGVETFLDTPVKRYSSGMRVRLGFAVAAHLEPEILVVDEVLAVGDAEFQRKCLGRMNDVAAEGRTVLFVSHQMEAIQSLCSRAVWLDKGRLLEDGKAATVVGNYLAAGVATRSTVSLADREDRTGAGGLKIISVSASSSDGRPAQTGAPLFMNFDILSMIGNPSSSLNIRVALRDDCDRLLSVLGNDIIGKELHVGSDVARLSCFVEKLMLPPGSYTIDISLRADGILEDKLFGATSIDVVAGDFHGSGKTERLGLFHISHDWSAAA